MCDEHIPAFQNSLLSDPEYYFSYPNWTKFEKTIIKLDKKLNKIELLKNNDIRAHFSKTVQFDSELFSVERAQVVKYSGLQSSQSLQNTLIYNLGTNLIGHSLANLLNQYLYVTGGTIQNDSARDTGFKIDIKAKTKEDLPNMNQGRCFHSSIIHCNKLYLIGGATKFNGPASNFLDVLDLSNPFAWGILHQGNALLKLGESPLVSSFSPHEILCAGGCADGTKHSRVVTFDVKK